ncbi:hypothetical protein N181_21475 [Sinorhizobium fredii USDA 205]|uniref:Uncharacterized protein n=1 Tax=Rhizobium fredii TaxID=380 RepID=A0A844A9M6_RHIFR|nr:hypothetical protein [Sinorhizobium fredii]KSV86352.1 hypothetical protein N181_21475 [Sinorhizobium fredii USDA 205]MQX09663.1 hypothetical protein [Sinorhizobium fredii]UTY46805.1 hypothetical protein EPK84_08195 [Sinorhizobium fredii]GEC34670.1 hypothetical protein EFR01_48410 [Sinorhizobium fredii]GLS11589.1 hypothetical protein GCM10007864_52200 [Sinorhizobium fredii]
MTITANFLTGPRLIVAGSRFAAVFGPFGLALSAKRLAMPNLTGWFNAIMLAGERAFSPAAAVCPVPAAHVARARSTARH